MIRTPRSVARLSALMLTFVASGCGGRDDSTGPQVNPDFMVGEWIAESMVVTSKAILAGYGQSSSESGVLTVEGQYVIFMRQLPNPEESRARWERAGSSVILESDTNFDFNLDGTMEAAALRTKIVPR